MAIAHHKATEGLAAGEAPIGAVIIDSLGEVLGCGRPMIKTNNDPSMVAAMSAWRACGARDHWKDKTLFLTCGPDAIAYSMFHIFNFGQLVVGSDRVYAGQTDAVRKLKRPIHVLGDKSADLQLSRWIKSSPRNCMSEYLAHIFRRENAASCVLADQQRMILRCVDSGDSTGIELDEIGLDSVAEDASPLRHI